MTRLDEGPGENRRAKRAALPVGIWPEMRLFAAILEDAHLCLCSREHASPATRAEARAWVEGAIPSAPLCSFREICDMFMLDEGAVRRRLIGGGRTQRRVREERELRAAS